MEIKQLQEMAKRIKSRRNAMKYTQEQFAERIGIETSSYTKIENAFQQPSLDTLMKIAKELNTSIDFILYGEDGSQTKDIDQNDILNAILRYSQKDKLLHASTVLKKLADLS